MRSGPLHDIVQQLRQAAERIGAERTDAELLTRYVNHRDHEALARIVHWHAPMLISIRYAVANGADVKNEVSWRLG